MKDLAITSFRDFARVLGVMALCPLATVGTAFADNSITKTFEFGAGTPLSRSHVRTFPLPCGTEGGVAAVVKFQRLGPVGASNIPIIIELREPDTAPDQEGPVVETKAATAKTTEQTITLSSQSSNRGCTLPWRVRVKHANEGAAPFRTFGSIRLDFDGRLGTISVQTSAYGKYLNKDSSKEYKLGDVLGLQQGIIEIEANWRHIIGTDLVTGPNPVKLKWQLIDPNGTVLTVEAYSSNEARSELTRFKLLYQVTKCITGQWKLKITNNTNDDAFVDETKAELLPGCPN